MVASSTEVMAMDELVHGAPSLVLAQGRPVLGTRRTSGPPSRRGARCMCLAGGAELSGTVAALTGWTPSP